MSKSKTAAIVLAGLAAFVLLGAALAGAGFYGGRYLNEQRLDPQPTVVQPAAQPEQERLRMFDAMKQKMPAEYDEVVRQLLVLVETIPAADQRQDELGLLIASVVQKHARRMYQASDDSLSAALKAQLDLLALVASRETPATCARFALEGPTALAHRDSRYEQADDATAAGVFRALAGAIENPQPAEPATDSDWAETKIAFLSGGGTDAELQSLSMRDPKDERLCAAMLRLYRAVLMVPGAAGRRVRAEMAYSMASE